MDHITLAFESLAALPSLDSGFLRHILLQAIDDPLLATDTALAEHLALVPRVLGLLQPSLVRLIVDDAHPGLAKVTADLVANVAGVIVDMQDRPGISTETLSRLCQGALRDPACLAHYLEGKPVSPFL